MSSPEPSIKTTRRDEIIERDKSRCYLCGTKLEPSQVVIDHIIPTSRGGTKATCNLAVTCFECDKRKADHLLSELDWIPLEVKARLATLRRESAKSSKRLLILFKRVQLAVIALAVTQESRLDSLIEVAKKK